MHSDTHIRYWCYSCAFNMKILMSIWYLIGDRCEWIMLSKCLCVSAKYFWKKICFKNKWRFGFELFNVCNLYKICFCKMSVIAKCVVTACNKMAYIYKKKLAWTLISRSHLLGHNNILKCADRYQSAFLIWRRNRETLSNQVNPILLGQLTLFGFFCCRRR